MAHLVAFIALDSFNRRRFLPNFLFFIANGGRRSFFFSDIGKCDAIATRSDNLEEVTGVLLPIKEQAVRIRDGLRPFIGLLSKFIFKVL